MLRVLMAGMVTSAMAFFNWQKTRTTNGVSSSTWRVFRSLISSTVSRFGGAFVRSLTESAGLYECVNTLLANSTSQQHNVRMRRRHREGVSDMSRPSFRRRNHRRHSSLIRIVSPTININIHPT